MIRLCYEGEHIPELIELIEEEQFVILDRFNREHYPEQSFIDVIESRNELELGDKGTSVFLMPSIKKQVDVSDFPDRIFLEHLKAMEDFPQEITLCGDIKRAFELLRFLLKHYVFCLGFDAESWAYKKFQEFKQTLTEKERERLSDCKDQPLKIYWEDWSKNTLIYFWSGEEDFYKLMQRDFSLAEVYIVLRVKRSLVLKKGMNLLTCNRFNTKNRNASRLWNEVCSRDLVDK